jgi:hypothetical protein
MHPAFHNANLSALVASGLVDLSGRHTNVRRAAFGFTSFRNYRIRSLLYAGKPNWDLLATITPR